jgi:PPOX class probable F420-dependent enzyme
MDTMTPDEIRSFLLDHAHTGKLATVRADGRPHVVPIWYDMDGDDLIFTTWHASVKGKNIDRDGRVAICVDNEQPPFDYVMIEGTATLLDDMAELHRWATRIGGRYMGADQAEAFGERNGIAGELVVRVTPTNFVAYKNVAE